MSDSSGSDFGEAPNGVGDSSPGLLGELGEFLWQNKRWWLIPMLVIFLLVGILVMSMTRLSPIQMDYHLL